MEDIDLLTIKFFWPWDRLALGWEVLMADEEYDYDTFVIFLFFITLEFNFQR